MSRFITRSIRAFGLVMAAGYSFSSSLVSGALTDGMEKGSPGLKSVGALAFGPEGILFVADPKGAAVIALATGDTGSDAAAGKLDVESIDAKIAGLLGTTADDILIHDLAVNPLSGKAYLSVSRGQGPEASPTLVRVSGGGVLEMVALDEVLHSRLAISDAPEDKVTGEGRRARNQRLESVTDLAFLEGRLAIAGLSNEEFSSTLRVAAFPFDGAVGATGVEIFHGAHGRLETNSPIRTFTPMEVDGEPTIVASYTCTPLVTIPLSKLRPEAKVKGVTVAELGNRNRPLDMITFAEGDETFILMANSARGVMKVSTDGIESVQPIEEGVPDGGTRGLPYETIESWSGITQLDKLSDTAVVVLRQDENGAEHLEQRDMP